MTLLNVENKLQIISDLKNIKIKDVFLSIDSNNKRNEH